MPLIEKDTKFDNKKIQQILRNENQFISHLFSIVAFPQRRSTDEADEEVENGNQIDTTSDKKPRAKSLQELEERLKTITSNKKRLSYKEKLAKKGLKNRLKKKTKQVERKAKLKLERAAKIAIKEEIKEEVTEDNKPVFNSENKLVYSKIDFANLGKKKHKKHKKDPKKLLEEINEEKQVLDKLEQEGNIHEVVQIKEKKAWKNALAKAEGQKVKDDPTLLKKSVKKKEQKVRSSKKKWEARIHGVEKSKEQRQKKRKENIDKKKKDKKVKKMKSASKRGKIIPGF